MERLFSDSEVFKKERPNSITNEQKQRLISSIADDILSNDYSKSDRDEIEDDMEGIFPFNETGFELAKELDSYSANADYDFTSDFIEFLEHLSFKVDDAKEENVKLWVKAHDIKPKLEDKSKLRVKESIIGTRFREGDEIFINYHYPETAVYVVDKDPDRKGGTLIAYEKIELYCELYES